ncbi:hypothetical protein GQ600_11038 [Phytophthora cactorum]|nr:hypothetical protein GQ600_11038 [Phytophthora cactorum]
MTDNIPSYVREGVKQRWPENSASPPDQLSVELPGYYSKIRIPSDQGYIFEPEFWFQVDNRETPVHVDHGRVVSYIPPSARHCFKVWVFFPPKHNSTGLLKWGNKKNSFNRMMDCTFADVLVQYPGDVVYLNNLVQHYVLLRYQPETANMDKCGASFGDVIVIEKDRVDSFTYATKIASGSRRGSKDAWVALLSAYCVMEGREWHDTNYKEEKRMFMEKLQAPEETIRASKAAAGKWDKKKRLVERLKATRDAKKQKNKA